MPILSKNAKERIVISLTSDPVGKEVIQAIEEGGGNLSGNGVPANSLGNNGDLYVDLLTGDLYKKYNNQWAEGGTGPQGPQGIQGVKGDQGDPGETGPQGIQGENGEPFSIAKVYVSVAALIADTSPVGINPGQFAIIDTGNVNDSDNARLYLWNGSVYSYVTDLSGATGMQGPQGIQGIQGVKGDTGATGEQGPQGIQGIQGEKGDQGDPGINTWGSITGTLSDQTDLQEALDAKFNNPTGNTTQYIAGDGSLITFPTIGTAANLITEVYNESGVAIPQGSVIYLDGPHGNLPIALLAMADNETDSILSYGIIQNTIGSMSNGYAVQEGRLENINTNIAGWNEGDILFLSPTVPGGITNVKPVAPNHLVFVGILVRKHPTQGVIQVKIQNGYELDELHNVSISGSLADKDTLVYELSTKLWKNVSSNLKLSKGTKTIFCIDNGDFANGQAAIDAASAGDTILFGAKAGGWGNITIPAGKKLSLKGLQAARSVYVQLGNITFSPTTGTQILENELYIENMYIYSTSGSVVTFGGTAPARVRMAGCYILSGTSNRCFELTNTHVNSSFYLYDSYSLNGGNSVPVFDSALSYVRLRRSALESGSMSLRATAGSVESVQTEFVCNTINNTVELTTSGVTFLATNNCLFSNSTTNGSGVLVATGAVFTSNLNVFSIATGTGYCVRGTGAHLYGAMNLSNSVAVAYNVKVQNTLSNIPLTTTFTPSA